MSFLDKIFGKKKSTASVKAPEAAPALASPAAGSPPAPAEEEPIRGWDEYGRELLVPRQQWRTEVLPRSLQQVWGNPDQLHALVAFALRMGFAAEVLEAARQQARIDTDKNRSAVLLAAVCLELDRVDEADQVIQSHLAQQAPSAVLLTNLAKVQVRRGDKPAAMETLWKALELNPNLEDALYLYATLASESGGEKAELEAFRKTSELPGSWRAQIWIARARLLDGKIDEAMAIYKSVMKACDPLPSNAFMQITGDLGNEGYLAEIIELAGPCFRPDVHGLLVGKNVIKACYDLHRDADARVVLDALYKLKQPEWKETLDYWQKQLDDRTHFSRPPQAGASLRLTVSPIEGPVWARRQEGFDQLVPAKDATAVRIGIIAPSMRFAEDQWPGEVAAQRESHEGFISRSLALYLAEQVHLSTTAYGSAIFTRLEGNPGFVLASAPYDPATIKTLAGQGPEACQFVLTGHIDATPKKEWRAEFSFIEVATGTLHQNIKASFFPENPHASFNSLAAVLQVLAVKFAGAQAQTVQEWAAMKDSASYGPQLFARAQTLLVLSSVSEAANNGQPSLLGERQIFDGLLLHSLERPADPIARMLLITALSRHRSTGSSIYREYERSVCQLQRQNPLPAPAGPLLVQATARLFA